MSKAVIKGSADAAERRSLGRSISSAFQAFHASLTLLVDPRIAVPYLTYFLIQMLLLAAYLAGNTGPPARLWALTVGGITPETLGHYPAHLLLLQPVLGRIEIVLEIFLKSIFHGATVYLVTSAMRRRKPALGKAFSRAGRRYPHLLGVSLVSSLAVYAVVFLGARLSFGVEGPARYAFLGGGIAMGLVVQSLFVYAIPLIMIDRSPAGPALAAGISLSLRTFTKTLLIVFIPFLLTVPTILLDLKAEMIALQLSPDFMIHNHIASRVMELVSIYLITAAATVIFLARKIDRPAGTSIDMGGAV
jgi:hypothetical protein